ncbi:hypothetical protein Glove_52g17 [Diversispora epigaea]|uniref:Uncharacterized protein n=1 Tax=Diversispora epigaea TaxID=1348612 RepID=A0A397JJY3_9GLOM|nr:hypothetical protein Glove_52g17 [Diversispora epigaea]
MSSNSKDKIVNVEELDFNKFDYVVVHRSNSSVGEKSIEEKLENFELPSDYMDEDGNHPKKYWNLIGTFYPPKPGDHFEIKYVLPDKDNKNLFKKYYEDKKFINYLYELPKDKDKTKPFIDTFNTNDGIKELEFYIMGNLRNPNQNLVRELIFIPRVNLDC